MRFLPGPYLPMNRTVLLVGPLLLAVAVGCGGGRPTQPSPGDSDVIVPSDAAGGDSSLVGDPSPAGDSTPAGDGGGDAFRGDTAVGDSDPLAGLSRGMRWVRTQPMFISGLNVRMTDPPKAFVNQYFDDFHATATHLWMRGLPAQVTQWQAHGHPEFRWLSWVLPDGTSPNGPREVLGGLGANPVGRIGYQVGDEPGLACEDAQCSMAELLEFEVGVNAVRVVDPEALIFVNFSSGAEGIRQMLDYYGTSMDGDVVSYDAYSRQSSEVYLKLNLFREAGLSAGIPYWRYLKSYYKGGGDEALTESDMRWNVYTGLVYGYTGHSWFLYQIPDTHVDDVALFTVQGTHDSPTSPEFSIAAQLNLELRNIGRVITQLTSTAVHFNEAALGGLWQPDGTTPFASGSGGEPYITSIDSASGGLLPVEFITGVFVDRWGEHYVMLQNVNHTNASFPMDNDDTGQLTVGFDFSGAPASLDQSKVLVFDPVTAVVGDVSLTGSGVSRDVTFALEAGAAVFFKYATGRSFEMQSLP